MGRHSSTQQVPAQVMRLLQNVGGVAVEQLFGPVDVCQNHDHHLRVARRPCLAGGWVVAQLLGPVSHKVGCFRQARKQASYHEHHLRVARSKVWLGFWHSGLTPITDGSAA